MDFLGIPGLLEPDQVRDLLHAAAERPGASSRTPAGRERRPRRGHHPRAARRCCAASSTAWSPPGTTAPASRTASPTPRSARTAADPPPRSPAPTSCSQRIDRLRRLGRRVLPDTVPRAGSSAQAPRAAECDAARSAGQSRCRARVRAPAPPGRRRHRRVGRDLAARTRSRARPRLRLVDGSMITPSSRPLSRTRLDGRLDRVERRQQRRQLGDRDRSDGVEVEARAR